MDRRHFISGSLVAVAGSQVGFAAALASADKLATSSKRPARRDASTAIAVLAELVFPEPAGDRAATLLAELAAATRAEPGCRRYEVGQDVVEHGRFHLSELWDDLSALAAHFDTPHMTSFSTAARELGYTAPWMKQITIDGIEDLNSRALREIAARGRLSDHQEPAPC